MGSFTLIQIVILLLAAFAGSTVVSSIGFGIGMVAIPVLLLVLDPQTSVVMLNTVTVPVTFLIVWRNREHLNVRETAPIAGAGVIGALAGAFILATADTSILRISIVVLIIVLTALTAFNFNRQVPASWLVGPIIGFVVGLMLGALGVGGPLLVLFVLTLGWHRHTVRASLALYLLFIMTATVVGYAASNSFTSDRIFLIALAIWPILLGFWVGDRIARRMNEVIFRRATIGVIVATSFVVLAREVITL